MSLTTDFELVWKSFEDKVLSYIAKNTIKNEVTEWEDLMEYYNSTIHVWEDPSKVQHGFLSKWKTSVPALEKDFLSVLYGFHFQKPGNVKKTTPVPYIGGTLAVTLIGGIVGYMLPKTSFLKMHLGNLPVIIIGLVVFAVVGGGVIKAVYENAVGKSCQEIARQYNEQFEKLHVELLTLCKKFS